MDNRRSLKTQSLFNKRSLTRLFLVAMVGLLAGGGALTASPLASPQAASAVDSPTKTIVQSANLSTTDQNMWGSGASTPTDVELVLFNEAWNESETGGDIAGGCE